MAPPSIPQPTNRGCVTSSSVCRLRSTHDLQHGPSPQQPKKILTGVGSRHVAPIIDGLTIVTGRWPDSSTRMYSANAFVYVYVFGRRPINCGVRLASMSSFIQLQEQQSNITIVTAEAMKHKKKGNAYSKASTNFCGCTGGG